MRRRAARARAAVPAAATALTLDPDARLPRRATTAGVLFPTIELAAAGK